MTQDLFEYETTTYDTLAGRVGADWVTIPSDGSSAQERMDAATQKPLGTNAYARRVETTRLNRFIALELALVEEVEYILSAYRDRVFYVWVIVEVFDDSVRRRIYGRQAAVIEEFPTFEFDFYIVARGGRNLDELVTESVEVVYERPRNN